MSQVVAFLIGNEEEHHELTGGIYLSNEYIELSLHLT
jgi:hypothetical protein